jgi:hypothetical protein
MNCKSSLSASILALVLSMGFAVPSMAADDESGQKPPSEAQTEQKPVEDNKCASIDTGYVKATKGATFHIMLKNTCERRLRCTVNIYHVDSRGPHKGAGTLMLAPKSKGDKANKSYVMKVGEMGGSANISHECKKI